MKKMALLTLILTSAILLVWVSASFAAEILGYPLVEKQAKFYTIILAVIAASVSMVFASYLFFWLADFKKKEAAATLRRGKKVMGGELVVALQSAK